MALTWCQLAFGGCKAGLYIQRCKCTVALPSRCHIIDTATWHYTFCLPRDSQLLMKGKSSEEYCTKMGHSGCAKSERFLWKHIDWANAVTLLDFSPICIQTQQRSRGCFCNTTQVSINIWNWMKHMSSLYLRIFFHKNCCHLAFIYIPKIFFWCWF